MPPSRPSSRREFLSTLGAASIAGVAHAASPSSAARVPEGERSGSLPSAPPADASSDYLLAPGLVYLNTASAGPTSRAVLDRTIEAWRELETNPVRMVYGDGPLTQATEHARERAAALLGCRADELQITRSTTDGMNTIALALDLGPGDQVLTTDQEHDGGNACWRYLARRRGVLVDTVPIGHTEPDPRAIVRRFADAMTAATRVLSVSHVLSSTGLLMPVAELSALARDRGIVCIVDGAQAVGELHVDVKALGCHAYAASGHKFLMGPKGTGLLYVDCDAEPRIELIQREAGRKFVCGSTGIGNLPIAIGLGVAVEAMLARGLPAVERHVLALRNRAWEALARIPGVTLVGPPPGPLATALVAFRIPDAIDSHDLQLKLRDKHNVMAKMVEKRWFNGLRFSPHVFNTEADIDAALEALRVELG